MLSTPNHFLSPCSSRKLNNTVLYPPLPNLHFNRNLKIQKGRGGNWNLPEKQYIPQSFMYLVAFDLFFPFKYLHRYFEFPNNKSFFCGTKYIYDPNLVSGYICFMKFAYFTTIDLDCAQLRVDYFTIKTKFVLTYFRNIWGIDWYICFMKFAYFTTIDLDTYAHFQLSLQSSTR